ncbi:hypothetical protein BH10PLA2_BH10PLA2_19120 [soil metagenome]
MPVNVKHVKNRRAIQYRSLDDLVQDARQLCQSQVRTLGNKSYGEILEHLAVCMNGCIDGSKLKIPWPIRTVARLLKKRILNGGLSPGFRHTRANDALVWTQHPLDCQVAFAKVEQAVKRLQAETKRSSHPVLGKLSHEEWNTFHLRHSEMHMSFVVPE